jgi:hypothetical protein
MRQRLFNFISERPNGASVQEIMDAVYWDDPKGGPTRHGVVAVMVRTINEKLDRIGYPFMIRGTGGPGSRYSLVDVDTVERSHGTAT